MSFPSRIPGLLFLSNPRPNPGGLKAPPQSLAPDGAGDRGAPAGPKVRDGPRTCRSCGATWYPASRGLQTRCSRSGGRPGTPASPRSPAPASRSRSDRRPCPLLRARAGCTDASLLLLRPLLPPPPRPAQPGEGWAPPSLRAAAAAARAAASTSASVEEGEEEPGPNHCPATVRGQRPLRRLGDPRSPARSLREGGWPVNPHTILDPIIPRPAVKGRRLACHPNPEKPNSPIQPYPARSGLHHWNRSSFKKGPSLSVDGLKQFLHALGVLHIFVEHINESLHTVHR